MLRDFAVRANPEVSKTQRISKRGICCIEEIAAQATLKESLSGILFFPFYPILSFVMGPHADDFHDPEIIQDLVHESMLNAYASGTGSRKISD